MKRKKSMFDLGLLLKSCIDFHFQFERNGQPQILILQGFLPYKGKVD